MKKIVLLGLAQGEKTTLFWQINQKYAYQPSLADRSGPLVNYTEAFINFQNNYYLLIDTPVFSWEKNSRASQQLIEELLKKSQLTLWVVKAWEGIGPSTKKLSSYLRQFSLPKILVLGQVQENSKKQEWERLGLPCFWLTSKDSLAELMEKIISWIPAPNCFPSQEVPISGKLKLILLGPPNSGKSTLLNFLLQKERSLVSSQAGTTEEPVRSYWDWKNWSFELADTAGRKKSQKPSLANRQVFDRSDLVWTVIDGSEPLTKSILQIIHLAEEKKKPLLILVNKADLLTPVKKREITEQIRIRLKSLSYLPIIFLSAKQGQGVSTLLTTLSRLLAEAQKRFSKKQLAQILTNRLVKNSKLKIYFLKHYSGLTHSFVFFVNNPRWVHFSYQRYLSNYLRKALFLLHLPLKLTFKKS